MTVRGSVLTDTSQAVTAAVAEHVRALRHARGWSLDQLATRSGVSKGMVVQIEAARTNPSVGTLCRLSDAFGVTVGRLLEPAADRTVRITAADDAPLLWQGGFGGFARLIGSVQDAEAGSPVELWEWRLAPNERFVSAEHAAGTREMLHVVAGAVTVTVDGADHEVHIGQTMEFRGDRPHAYRNEQNITARLMMVVVVPPA
jgi:transcriptional regulator with XRE-family HTH domain